MDVAPVVAINQSINTIISDVHYFTERKEKNGVVHSAREMKASGYHRIKLLNHCQMFRILVFQNYSVNVYSKRK